MIISNVELGLFCEGEGEMKMGDGIYVEELPFLPFLSWRFQCLEERSKRAGVDERQ
jgi:hypothetical protein